MRRLALLSITAVIVVGLAWLLIPGSSDESPQARTIDREAVAPSPVTEPSSEPAAASEPVAPVPQRALLPDSAGVVTPTAEPAGAAATLSAAAPRAPRTSAEPEPAPIRTTEHGPGNLASTPGAADCSLSLNRAVLARDVVREERRPVGVDDSFVARGEPVWVFMSVNNPAARDQELTIRWDHLDSDHVFTQTIPAGQSPSWRTWVYHTVWPTFTGRWRVEIFAPGRCKVGEITFEALGNT